MLLASAGKSSRMNSSEPANIAAGGSRSMPAAARASGSSRACQPGNSAISSASRTV